MTRQLPYRPNLEQLKNQAKSLLKGHRAAVPEALVRVRETIGAGRILPMLFSQVPG
jgi:hypothetical protein